MKNKNTAQQRRHQYLVPTYLPVYLPTYLPTSVRIFVPTSCSCDSCRSCRYPPPQVSHSLFVWCERASCPFLPALLLLCFLLLLFPELQFWSCFFFFFFSCIRKFLLHVFWQRIASNRSSTSCASGSLQLWLFSRTMSSISSEVWRWILVAAQFVIY